MQKDVPRPAKNAAPQRAPALAMDSAEHLLAAYPVLTAIAKYAGIIGGGALITQKIIAGKDKEAKRNAVIILTAVFIVFLLIIACVMWLAML
jgi:Na+-driven multidrug efflux pump